MKKLLKFLLFLAVLGVLSYIVVLYFPKKNISSVKADYIMTVGEMTKDFNENEKQSNVKYIDAVIVVDGKVSEITTDDNNNQIVYLVEDNNLKQGVLCKMRKQASIKIGERIKVKGECSGYLGDIILKNGMIENK